MDAVHGHGVTEQNAGYKRGLLAFLLLILCLGDLSAQPSESEEQLLKLVDDVFRAMEAQDTIAFREMFVPGAQLFATRTVPGNAPAVRALAVSDYRFRPGQIVRERMRRETTRVIIERNIAVVWAPYDLWINNRFSHCGIDVFTFLKNETEWKIVSLAYTIEQEGCQPGRRP